MRTVRSIFLMIVLAFGCALISVYCRLPTRGSLFSFNTLRLPSTALYDLDYWFPESLAPVKFEAPQPKVDEQRELQDLADLDSGASIVMRFTTQTYQIDEPWHMRYMRKAIESLSQPDYSLSHTPNSTISTRTSCRTCWPFIGAYGTVGIQLPELRQIVSATILFTSSSRLRTRVGVPRGFRLWGLVPDARRGLLPSSCLIHNDLFAPHLVPLLDEVFPVLLSEWTDDTDVSTDVTIPYSPCSVPLDFVVFELRGSSSDVPFTCVNRFQMLGL